MQKSRRISRGGKSFYFPRGGGGGSQLQDRKNSAIVSLVKMS